MTSERGGAQRPPKPRRRIEQACNRTRNMSGCLRAPVAPPSHLTGRSGECRADERCRACAVLLAIGRW